MWPSGNVLASINIVGLCWTRLVPGWLTVLGQIYRLGTEPGTQVVSAWAISPWVGKNEYWLCLNPLLGKNGESCIAVGRVTRTAGILAYSRLKALAVNGAGHPVDVVRMLAELGSTLATSKRRGGMSSLATDLSCLCTVFLCQHSKYTDKVAQICDCAC